MDARTVQGRQHGSGRPPAWRSPRLAAAAALAVAVGVLGGYGLSNAGQVVGGTPAGEATGDTARGTVPAGTDPLGPPGRPDGPPAQDGPAGPSAPEAAPGSVPAAGSGEFVVATGTGARLGASGRLVRFQVVVELVDGRTPVAPAAFAEAVERTLGDPRGWTAGRAWSFQRVADAPADVVVHLATPATTDRICGRYGLNTGGEVSCRGGRDVVINLRRWLLAVPWYADAVDGYRTMVVNHEVGHFLGHDHATCPGPGRPAPVMQTQTYGLEGCARNPWPYPDGHGYVD